MTDAGGEQPPPDPAPWAPPGLDRDVDPVGSPAPEFPPAPPPPPDAAAPRRGLPGSAIAAIVAAVVGLLALAVVVIAVVGDQGDTDEVDGRAEVDDGGETGPTPAGFRPFVDSEGEYRVEAPPTWIVISLRGDVDRAAADAADGDARVAEAMRGAVQFLPRQAVAAGFVRPEIVGRDTFVTNLNLIATPDAPRGADVDDLLRLFEGSLEQFGATVLDSGTIETSSGTAARVEYRLAEGPTNPSGRVRGVQYHYLDGSTVWSLTFATDDFGSYEREFDQIAATFDLG